MTKVSKNIKKLRTEKGLTQEALGEKINVTRQAISSWENGRTQPDLEMLGLLADAFEVEIEHLIYGEKRKTQIENTPVSYKSTAVIAISVLGAILIAAGAALIFWTGWLRLPTAVQSIVAVLPLLAGQATAVYTFLKKQNSVPWRESAAIAWMAGLVATIALISNVFNLAYGYVNWLIIDAVLILPIVYLFNVVSPMVVYYYMIIHWSMVKGTDMLGYPKNEMYCLLYFAVGAALLAAMAAFVKLRKKTLSDIGYTYALWITVIAGTVFALMLGVAFGVFVAITALVCVVSFYALSKKDATMSSPFYTLGLFGVLAMSVMLAFADEDFANAYFDKSLTLYFLSALCIGIIGVCLYLGRESLKNNIFKISEISCLLAVLLLYIAAMITSDKLYCNENTWFLADYIANIFFIVIRVFVFALSIIFIFHGAKENKLFYINTGFLSICALTAFLLWVSEMSLFVNGIILTILGGVLIYIDIRIAKRKELVENAGTTTKGQVQQDEK